MFSKDSIKWIDLARSAGEIKVEGSEAVQNAIDNILSVQPGERLFKPKFGCNLESLLFEPIDDTTSELIRIELYNCVENNDPRISVIPSQTTVIPSPDEYRYDINLAVEVLGIGDANFKFSLKAFG